MKMTMNEKSSNGWVASKDAAAIDIKQFKVDGTDIKLRCAAACGPILAAFASEFHKTIEPIDAGTLDDWGYAYRPVRGETTGLSNHASGTAIDLNAVKHPLGKENTFTGPQQVLLKALVKKYGLRWGGTYKTRKDDMHFEVIETPAQVKIRINKLGLK
jgi:hypothetical protein